MWPFKTRKKVYLEEKDTKGIEVKFKDMSPEELQEFRKEIQSKLDLFVNTTKQLGWHFDYSEKSLEELERCATQYLNKKDVSENTKAGVLYAMGIYLGEVLRRNVGGEWKLGLTPNKHLLVITTGDYEQVINPVLAIEKKRASDISLTGWYKVVKEGIINFKQKTLNR